MLAKYTSCRVDKMLTDGWVFHIQISAAMCVCMLEFALYVLFIFLTYDY